MKKAIAVKRAPKDVKKGIARGDYDNPSKVDEMLSNRVLDKIIEDIRKKSKAA